MTGVALVVAIGIAPFLPHNLDASGWLSGIVAAIQITVLMSLLSRTWTTPWRAMGVVAGVGLVAGSFMILPTHAVGLAVSGTCHAVAYGSLLVWFGGSLRGDREPVVTGFARRMRHSMPVAVVRYTGSVTIAWCVFFAAQLTLSAGLLLLAPAPVWAVFVNLLNLPLLAAMVLGEAGVRMILFRTESATGLIDTLAALRRSRFLSADPP